MLPDHARSAESGRAFSTMQCPEGTTWLILGSGLGARGFYRALKDRADVIATCNAGLDNEPAPDVYWLTDAIAVHKHFEAAQQAHIAGAYIITSRKSLIWNPALADIASEIVEYDKLPQTRWRPGKLVNARTAGCFLVQVAVNHGAEHIILVGMTGYHSTPGSIVQDYDDGRPGDAKFEAVMRVYGPMMQSIFDQSPHVQFDLYGHPAWPWAAPNLNVCRWLEPVHA